jgi:hypothetical protein
MQVVVMSEHTIFRNDNSVHCKFCGEEIAAGELCVKRLCSNRRGSSKVVYAHKKCEEDHRL